MASPANAKEEAKIMEQARRIVIPLRFVIATVRVKCREIKAHVMIARIRHADRSQKFAAMRAALSIRIKLD